MHNDELIGSAEVCSLLKIDRSTLSRRVQLGKLSPALRLPGRTGALLFRRGDVEALAAKAKLIPHIKLPSGQIRFRESDVAAMVREQAAADTTDAA